MTINYKKEYINSLLAYISYANMNGSKDGDVQWENLVNMDLLDPLNTEIFLENFLLYLINKNGEKEGKYEFDSISYYLNFFTDNFKVVKQVVERGFNGFSATTYQLQKDIVDTDFKAGQIFVSYRGTEKTVADFATDINLAFSFRTGEGPTVTFFNSIIKNESQERQARLYLASAIHDYKKVYVNGHSLGGYLAARSFYVLSQEYDQDNVKYSDGVLGVSTFNAAGLAFWGDILNKEYELANRIKNFYSMRGISVTASNINDIGKGTIISLFEHLGPRIPIYTESLSTMDNHNMDLIVKSLSLFDVMSELVENNLSMLRDSYGKAYWNEDAKTYGINKMLLQSSKYKFDYKKVMNKLADNLFESCGIQKTLSPPSIGLAELSNSKQDFINNNIKLEMLTSLDVSNLNLVDSNKNRGLLNALLNNIPYKIVVSESYNKGIFEKTEKNEVYNIENYTKEYLRNRAKFNIVYMYALENKLLDGDLRDFKFKPFTINGTEIKVDEEKIDEQKYVFFEQQKNVKDEGVFDNTSNFIYVNTTAQEADSNNYKHIYFSNYEVPFLTVSKDNAVVFDSYASTYFSVASNNAEINLMNNNSTFVTRQKSDGSNPKNNKIIIGKNAKNINIYHEIPNANINPVLIEIEDLLLSKLNVKKVITNLGRLSLEFKYDQTKITLNGFADFLISGNLYTYNDIINMVNKFEEAFISLNGAKLIIDEEFMDVYIKERDKKYKSVSLIENNNSIKISKNQNVEIKNVLNDYKNSNDIKPVAQKMARKMLMASIVPTVKTPLPIPDYEALKAYVDSVTNNTEIEPILPSSINQNFVSVLDGLQNPYNKEFVNKKLENFSSDKYSSNLSIDSNKYIVENVYFKYETKNYILKTYDDGHTEWVWNNHYYANRTLNGAQVDKFYDSVFVGVEINYYYPNSVTVLSNGNISGTDGSDILIGDIVTGQSNYYGYSGREVVFKAGEKPNGNDIIIGREVKVFSGNNLLLGINGYGVKNKILGGIGSDILITAYGTIEINYEYKTKKEPSTNENLAILMGDGEIYSSNAKNTILVDPKKGTSSAYIYATGSDTVISEVGTSTVFIGGYDALLLAKQSNIDFHDAQVQNNAKLDEFYNFYKVNSGKNKYYSGDIVSRTFLSKYDFADLSKVSNYSFVYGVGFNEIIVNDKVDIFSGGDSNITITGSKNTLYLNNNDVYDLKNSYDNAIYTIGYIKNNFPTVLQNILFEGRSNSLILGNSPYSINLNGYDSKVVFGTENNYSTEIIANESGQSQIFIDYDIKNLSVKTNNSINVSSNSFVKQNVETLHIESTADFTTTSKVGKIHVNDFFIKMNSELNLNDFSANSVKVENEQKTSVTNMKSDLLDINSGGDIYINETDIKLIDIHSHSDNEGGNYIQINATDKNETLKVQSDNVNTIVKISGEITNSDIEDASLQGYFKTDKLVLKGVMDGAAINSDNGVDIKVDGYINKLQLTNATNFDYKESRAGVVKSDVTIMNSSIINDITGFKNVSLMFSNSHLNNIVLDGFDINISVDSESSVNNVDIKASVKSNISIRPKSENVKFSNDTFRVNADNTNNTEISTTNDGYSVSVGESSGIRLNSNDGKTVSLSASKIGDLYLDNGIIDANVPQVNNLFVNFSKVRLLNSNVLKVANNLKVNTTDKIRYYNGSKCYLNGVLLQKRPEEIVVGNKVYSGIILDEIDNYMTLNTVYAYLTEGEVEYHPVNDTDLQFNQDPTEDRGNEIIGTGENNIINIEQNQSLKILGNETEMTYNFSGDMNYQHVFNYIRNNGLCIFNSTSHPDLTIKFNGVNKSDITYDYSKDAVSLKSTLKIKNKGVLIAIINDYNNFWISLSVLDNGQYVRLEDEDIRAIVEVKDPTDPTDPTGPTTPVDPTIPSGSVITGTDGNDYYQLTESKLYTINSSKGNDTYEFTVANSNQSVLNYTIGSGLSNIKTSPNNYLFLNIILKDIDRELISYDIVKNQIGTQSKLTILYENNPIVTIDNFIDVYLNLKLVNGSDVKEIDNTEINDIVFGIYGTDGDDVLTGNTTTTLFNPGKGNDILNIMGGNNTVYYRVGDGHKTVVNPTFAYTGILMKGDADSSLLSYQLAENNGLYVKYSGELIFTLLQPGSSSLQIEGRNEFVNFYQVVQDLQTIYGTDGDDVLAGNGSGTTIIETKKGNDIINLLGGQNSINYTIGNGYKTVNSENVSYTLNVTGVLNKELLTYEKNGLSAMDIKYDGVLIFTLQDPFSGTICLMEKYEYIYLSQIYQGLNTIKGTDGDDIIYGLPNGGAIIPGKGTDEINLTGGFNTLHYDFGIGIKHIKGEFPCMFQMYGDFDIDLFEFRKNGNSMDVIYNGDMILTIEYPLLCYMILNETGGFVDLSAFMH